MATPTVIPAFVDAEGILRTYLNGLTTLVGNGQEFLLGFFLRRPRSPYKGAYGLISRVGGSDAWNEAAADQPRISVSIFAPTKQAALIGAVAYANTLRTLAAAPPTVTGVRIMAADNITGPTYIPAGGTTAEEQYLVDADVWFLSN